MTEVLIGTGGWAYFNIPARDRLAAYARYYDFVEVNSTYYDIPPMRIVESWRRRVPDSFEFSVRCNRSIFQGGRLRNANKNEKTLRKMLEICTILRSKTLHILTPTSFVFDERGLDETRRFFQSVKSGNVSIAWEIRNKPEKDVLREVFKIMREFQIVHCVDLSREKPSVESNVLYSRLFGKGNQNIYQFDDEELKAINKEASKTKFEKSSLSFHGIKMHTDAMRLVTYRKTGKFPKVTNSVGSKSLEEVLREDTVFPTSKNTLVTAQGWRVFDLTKTRRAHTAEFLRLLPDRNYRSLEEVVDSLKSYF